MEQKIEIRKKFVKVIVWVVVIFAVMATLHITINYLDFPGILGFLKTLHGG